MNFDANALSNLMQLLNKMPNGAMKNAEYSQNTPQNAQNPFDKSKDDKRYARSPFVAQNGLGEQVDQKTFAVSSGNGASDQKRTQNDAPKGSPLESIMKLMSKKSDIEKMMPALANVFASKQKTETASKQESSDERFAPSKDSRNAPKQKENGKSEDVFRPVEFAGYTALCALNRLYFNLKN